MESVFSLINFRRNKVDFEDKLIAKAVKGDDKAFIEIIKIHKTYLYKTAYAYVKNEQMALDIIQETTYKAFLNIKGMKEPKFFKTWITRILINISINMMKKESKVVYIGEESPLVDSTSVLSIEEKLDLYNAIDLLKDSYKTAIILKYFNDLTINDIAEIMNISSNTVKSNLKRGRESLKNILKEDGIDE